MKKYFILQLISFQVSFHYTVGDRIFFPDEFPPYLSEQEIRSKLSLKVLNADKTGILPNQVLIRVIKCFLFRIFVLNFLLLEAFSNLNPMKIYKLIGLPTSRIVNHFFKELIFFL